MTDASQNPSAAAPPTDGNANAQASTGSPTGPYGITPYVARAVVRIQEHFRNSSDPLRRKGEAFVVGVFGEWGSGKSTVLDAIGASFDNKPPANTVEPMSIAARREPDGVWNVSPIGGHPVPNDPLLSRHPPDI